MPKRKKQEDSGILSCIGCGIIAVIAVACLANWLADNINDLFPQWQTVLVVICVVILIAAVWYLIAELLGGSKKQNNKTIPYKSGIGCSKHHDGISYERYVADKLRKMGYYAIRFTPRTGDHGADILATAPDGVQCAIQCKRYQSNVGNKAVQEALAGMTYYGCGRAIVATNSRFTPQAKDDAWRMGVKLFEEF